MQFYKLGTKKLVSCNINKYKIDWDGKSASKLQFNVKQYFKKYWFHHIVLEEFRIPGSLLRCDILNLNKKIAIEVSPYKVHGDFNKFFHKNRTRFWRNLQRDDTKIEWLEENGFIVAELQEEDIENLSRKLLEEKYNIII